MSRSPLLGYNTNVRHNGRVYHIQTEDSGLRYAHVITHLFADGGRIIATTKTSYKEQVEDLDIDAIVKKLMRDQHKAMFIALRDGMYDEEEEAPGEEPAASAGFAEPLAAGQPQAPANPLQPKPVHRPPKRPSGLYTFTRAARSTPPPSIFGSTISEKSLDEVILNYLAEESEEG